MPRLRIARRRLPVPRHGRHVASRRRSARACRCRTRRWPHRPADLARHGRAIGAGRCMHLAKAQAHDTARFSPPAAIRNAMMVHAAFGGSTNLLLHIPAIALRRRAAIARRSRIGTRSIARVPRLVDALPNGPVRSSDGARLPGRRRAGSDAAPARAGLARSGCADGDRRAARRSARLVASERASQARA